MQVFNPLFADIAWSGRPYQLLHKARSDMDELMKRLEKAERENAKMRELLQYVANNHLCSTWLVDGMKELGIEYWLKRVFPQRG